MHAAVPGLLPFPLVPLWTWHELVDARLTISALWGVKVGAERGIIVATALFCGVEHGQQALLVWKDSSWLLYIE